MSRERPVTPAWSTPLGRCAGQALGGVDGAGSPITIPAIPAGQSVFRSAEEAVKLSLDRELTATKQINALMDRAIEEHDHTTRNALEWFVEEQLEEVSSMETLLRMVQRAGEAGLLFVEHYLAQSQPAHYSEPSAELS